MTDDTLLPPAIESARLVWRDGIPESARFGDVYFSRDNGLEETRYVFLQHNRLPERFREVPASGSFVVAESGFGTGLNFLATWQAWREQAPEHPCVLHFVSAERYPLTRPDLQRALALWPELAPLAAQLLEQYPPLIRGTHRLVFDGGRVRLTLYFGDVLEAWDALDFRADAWFLDGFAPALNPDMWLDQAMTAIRRHSRPGTTVATFTAVGRVRRALAAEGFSMNKVPGFGRKRDMLAGSLDAGPDAPATLPGRITVIGAGLAGTLLARNLAERGYPVTLLDARPRPGLAASGNRQGALYVKLGVDYNAQTELALTALTFSQRCYQPYAGRHWHPTGLLQLAWNPREQERQARFLTRNHYPDELVVPVTPEQASSLTGVRVSQGGLWFPGGGWVTPSAICQTLASHPRIQIRPHTEVTRLTPAADRWHLTCRDGSGLEAEILVICAGHQSPELVPVSGKHRFRSIRGQVTHLPESTMAQVPQAVICGQKYLNPVSDGMAVTGASFDLHDARPDISATSHRENLEQLDDMLPGLLTLPIPDPEHVGGKVGFRCTTYDYQPVAGRLQTDSRSGSGALYLLTGLGSKGLAYGPLLAEYLADRISGQPPCLPTHLARRVQPERMFTTAAYTDATAEAGTLADK